MARLAGKVALITGGTNGMGAAAARLFAAEGATVIGTGSTDESVAAARGRMPGIELLKSNAGDAADARALVERVNADYGRIDILFVNAGTNRLAPLADVDEATFDRLFDITVRGPFFLIQRAVAVMPDGGSIILTSSTAAERGLAGSSVYGAAKAALRSLGRTLALELAPREIRVNTITPGMTNSNFGSKLNLSAEQLAGFGEMVARVPLARMAEPAEIAQAALYFASDESQYTTGAELRIDGGITAL
jgi:NAD(P)-dependent dehydrogenase (short-subunit alcohol dehydrogenase family)